MSDVPFIGSAPAKDFTFDRRTPERPAGKKLAPATRAKDNAPEPQLPNKTKVMTEFRKAFQVSYTFIDPDTDQVVARWPVAPAPDEDAPGAHVKQTL